MVDAAVFHQRLQRRFLELEGQVRLPRKSDPSYGEALRMRHSAILGLCALMDCFPYVVEPWMPPLMEGGGRLVCAREMTDGSSVRKTFD